MSSTVQSSMPQSAERQSPFGEILPGDSFKKTAAATSEILPILGKQLREIAHDLESSVVQVCGGFQGISKNSQDVVKLAEQAVAGDGDSRGGNELVASANVLLMDLLAKVQSSCEFIQQQTQRINRLEAQLAQVEKSLEKVEDISGQAKVVALNGRIEASRLGDAGLSFGVVADETKVLAVQAERASNEIKSEIVSLGKSLRSTSSDLNSRAKTDIESLEKTEATVREILDRLQRANETMTHSLAQTSTVSRQIQKDIASAVIAMQFQDRLNQRIEHIIEGLAELTHDLSPLQREVEYNQLRKLVRNWSAWFASRCTMQSERTMLSTADSNSSNDTNLSVELF